MREVKWLCFGIFSSFNDTLVHFFPQDVSSKVPYELTAKFQVFSDSIKPKSIAIEGVRNHMPDGIRIKDAFPEIDLQKTTEYFGLEISLSTNRPNVDLKASHCIVEVISPSNILKYRALKISDNATTSDQLVNWNGLQLKDRYQSTSFLCINKANQDISIELIKNVDQVSNIKIQANRVFELDLDNNQLAYGLNQTCSWGDIFAAPVYFKAPARQFVCYGLNRNVQTNELEAVTGLTQCE